MLKILVAFSRSFLVLTHYNFENITESVLQKLLRIFQYNFSSVLTQPRHEPYMSINKSNICLCEVKHVRRIYIKESQLIGVRTWENIERLKS